MKLGEGGEAFFVFETSDDIPASLQTSPVISPATSPNSLTAHNTTSTPSLQEPEYLDLGSDATNRRSVVWQGNGISIPTKYKSLQSESDILGINFSSWKAYMS
jgi:phosphatidate phosphatase LPIN